MFTDEDMTVNAFDPKTLASDLDCVRNIYADFLAGLTAEDWRLPENEGEHEWNLREAAIQNGQTIQCGCKGVKYEIRITKNGG